MKKATAAEFRLFMITTVASIIREGKGEGKRYIETSQKSDVRRVRKAHGFDLNSKQREKLQIVKSCYEQAEAGENFVAEFKALLAVHQLKEIPGYLLT